jgi:hypothetical protein
MATPIRIKRSAVPGKKPTTDQLQLGELALNFYDGKVFLKQDQGGVGVGTRIVSLNANEVGNTFYVNKEGNDNDTGLSPDRAFLTIKKAVGIATRNDAIHVAAGKYVEDNPLVLDDFVTIIGGDIRNCEIEPANPEHDIIQLGKAATVQDLSFVGTANTGSAVIAYRPLVGVSSDRFFDAARLIRQNLDFIANEAVGYLTSTDYKNPAFVVTKANGDPDDPQNCRDDIKDIYRAICHDITRGGNSKCVGAGKSYYTNAGALQHITGNDSNGYSVKEATIAAIDYSVGIARSCINNITWNGGYQTIAYQVKDVSIQADGGSYDIGNCANVNSAVTVCAGIVTTIIDGGLSELGGAGINTNFPGNNGAINSGILTSTLSPSQGVGIISKGPYIRNCTNFVKNSIGCKVDGFNADEGDQINNVGVQGSFNVDAFTQFNQSGIGVSVTNGAYCQLVSIFTICNDTAIYAGDGGQCDLTNSNSSFGTRGLVAKGIGDQTSRCSDRYTGSVNSTASVSQNRIVVSGVGNNRPYDGQALYFDRKYFIVSDIKITNGGSGYTSPPIVTVDDPTGPGIAIPAQATATVENGVVTVVTVRGGGSQYTGVPNVSFSGGGGSNAAATATIEAIYYDVLEATEPSAGITTISLVQNLNNEVGIGVTAFFARQSLQIVSSHSFQYVGAGNDIESAYPSRGGVTIQENEVISDDGGKINYTSTDQRGNFRIGDGVVIDQSTGTVSGNVYIKSLFTQVTPFILALGGD